MAPGPSARQKSVCRRLSLCLYLVLVLGAGLQASPGRASLEHITDTGPSIHRETAAICIYESACKCCHLEASGVGLANIYQTFSLEGTD